MAQSLKQDQISVPTDMIKGWSSETSPIFFMTSHSMDLIHWFFGSEPVEVMAYSTSKVLSEAGYETPDGIQAAVKHANGETALYHSSWIHPATFPSIAESRLEIIGDQGVLSLYARARRAEIYSKSVNQVITFEGPQTATEMGGVLVGAFRGSLELFYHSITTGEEPMTSAANTLTVSALEFALHDSLAEGKPVNVSKYIDQLRRALGG
jgi:predicted dehydrogenase